MNLINKRLLVQKIELFDFPSHEKLGSAKKLLENWKKALKDSDLEKTKEKSVQGRFLATFFESILDYTDITSGQEEWTLIQHPRIENDSKEPDGSLGWFTKDNKKTRAVIELKDAKTQLDKKQYRGSEKLTPIEQAYLYSTKYEGCNWIIVSNFKEIRLYNKYKTQEYYEKFNVIDLIEEAEFKRFYFLFCKKNLLSKYQGSVIDVLAKDTTEAEQDITKKFYSEYRQIRLNLLGHLIINNSKIQKEILLEKTQKLLDKFIFTLFCEDTSSLLPLNIVKDTYSRALRSFSSSEQRVWDEFKGLFQAIDKGNSRVKPPINAYNGGLFITDTVLDNLVIKDEFWDELIRLADYDFETDLNVNILGHIFEQSISDLESLKSELLGKEQDKKKNKRKKDGIYYTPEYITRYIVENTVGKYLEENPDKLSTIKILDPACGSGAFLNQAHSFLTNEYKARHEALINKKLEKGESITLFDYNHAGTSREILLNNLFGVDLNQESVEITKLALWLKTARGTEPLQNLDKNIKTGNSLIDDPEIAGNKAFNWNIEFKDIMDEGGFDVIIGNPPYVNGIILQGSQPKAREWLKNNYSTLIEKWDLYIAFIERGINLLKKNGYLTFIIPDAFITEKYASKLREYLLKETNIVQIDHFPNIYIFGNVGVHNIILTIKKTNPLFPIIKTKHNDLMGNIKSKDVANEEDVFTDFDAQKFNLEKAKFYRLGDICFISKGMVLNADEKKYRGEFVKDDLLSEKETTLNTKKIIEGEDVNSYLISNYKWLEWNTERVPNKISRPTFPELHEVNKLVTNKVGELKVSFDNEGFACDQTVRILMRWEQLANVNNKSVLGSIEKYSDLDRIKLESISKTYSYKFLLGLLNSKLVKQIFYNIRGLRSIDINPLILREISIPKISTIKQQPIADKAQKVLDFNNELYEKTQKALEILVSKYSPKIVSTALKTFYKLGWNELIAELEKQKVKVSLSNQEELQQWFDTKRSELLALDNKIKSLDKEINQEVYKLYGLTDDEIKTV